jgi:hypothetical protein
MLVGGVGVVACLGWLRLSRYFRRNPEAARQFAEHVVTPFLFGNKDAEDEEEPEAETPE